MGLEPQPPDAGFFREWDSRLPGQRRSLDRAQALQRRLGLTGPHPPVLTVVGSKGKGTAATYASAYLAAGGHRLVTVTSPSLRSTTERIRVDGAAVDPSTLARLGAELDEGIRYLPPSAAGYLSPSGLFTLAGLLLARQQHADYLVLEAGRGGRSDEVSLVEPAVVAITAIFGEHLAELGGSLPAVAADKAGVVGAGTAAVLLGSPPEPAAAQAVRETVAARSGGRLAVEPPPAGWPELPGQLFPPGLGWTNARLGCWAASRLLAATGQPEPPGEVLATTLGSVRLPGRLSAHRLPGSGVEIVADAAVSPAGFRTALEYARARLGGVDHVLLSLPDGKDLAGAVRELAGLPVTFVTVPASHLHYTGPTPPGWPRLPAGQLGADYLAGLGRRLLTLGTVSFLTRILELLEVPTADTFTPPARGTGAHPIESGEERLVLPR